MTASGFPAGYQPMRVTEEMVRMALRLVAEGFQPIGITYALMPGDEAWNPELAVQTGAGTWAYRPTTPYAGPGVVHYTKRPDGLIAARFNG